MRSLAWCRDHKGLRIYGWVILDNHFHAIVSPPELSRAISDLKKFTAREILDQVNVPTLIVSGDRDGFTPPTLSSEMHKMIPNSEHFVVKGGSHTAPIERPAEVSSRVIEFLRTRF